MKRFDHREEEETEMKQNWRGESNKQPGIEWAGWRREVMQGGLFRGVNGQL